MCGFAGVVSVNGGMRGDGLNAAVMSMNGAIKHRGPDDEGLWSDIQAGVALGHRRLSIIDLSATGHQPMVSHSGRLVIAYNGEIYNFQEIRQVVEGRNGPMSWRGRSDTEIILEAMELFGVEEALRIANGMFAFALWDRQERKLTLGRDRLGKKPLYYGWSGGSFIFASELKAIRRFPAFDGDIDRNALGLLMRHNYVPSPYSIYKGVFKLPPACVLSLDKTALGGHTGFNPSPDKPGASPKRYWNAGDVILNGAANQFEGDEESAADRLETLLKDAVKLRMVSDVPLGAFLSGGVDSATVVALMQSQSAGPVRTYTIGYEDDPESEAELAKAVARHLGTAHTELYVTAGDALKIIPQLPELSDEPISDTALIPTFLVSRLARRDVTVCLTGDGGDELFTGYPRYLWANWYFNDWAGRVDWMPNGVQRAVSSIAGLAGAVSGSAKLKEVQKLLPLQTPEEVYAGLNYHWRDPAGVVEGFVEQETVYSPENHLAKCPDGVQRMVYLDMASRLPDSLLAKVDRVTMSVSLEARCPILDHRLVEFSATIPTSMKIRGGHGKWLLRKVLYKHVPRELVERPKKGFSMPIKVWLKGPLRDWAEDLLDEGRLRREGFFNPAPIRAAWAEHLSGERNRHFHLWDVLMFQAWNAARQNEPALSDV
ncbi:MAG: asparagine synthase (glutamine-hydrolyzing) [Nitrospinae bacterium]|nr:asparagine synthase (glutamine-hydrolyzing) [Nitrospinota bacterium]